MVRSYWIGPVLALLAVTGLAWSQVLSPGSTPTPHQEHMMTVLETDKPPLKCKVLKMWHELDGNKAFLIQAVATGEMLTILQTGAAPSEKGKTAATKIFHWGDEAKPPAGAPAAPPDAAVFGTAGPTVEFPKTPYPPKTAADVPKVTVVGHQWPAAFAPEATDAKPVTGPPTRVVDWRPTVEAKPSDPDKTWPSAYAQEATKVKPPAMPIQMSGVDEKTTGPAIGPTAPGMPVQIKGMDTANAGTGPKPVVTQIVRSGDDKPHVPDAVTSVPPANEANPKAVVKVPAVNEAGPKAVAKAPAVNEANPKAVVKVPAKASPIVESSTTLAPKVASTGETKIPDWRQSWGRADPPVVVEPRPVVKADPPRKVESPVKAAVPSNVDLPHADAHKVDPLQQPDRYTKVPAVPGGNSKPIQVVKNVTEPAVTSAKPPLTPVPDSTKADKVVPPAKPLETRPTVALATPVKPPFTPISDLTKADKTTTPTKPVDVVPAPPLGMGSVVAAHIAASAVEPPPPVEKTAPVAKAAPVGPYDGGNAFTPAQPPPAAPKQTGPMISPANYAQQNMMPPMMPPMPPPGVVQIPMDRGVPSGMANAFTTPGTTRPIPSDFGQSSRVGNAFGGPTPASPQMALRQPQPTPYNSTNTVAMIDRRQLPVPAMAPVAPDQGTAPANNAPQLVAVLHDSLYPSQREWAADTLATQRHPQPEVVQALLSAAKEDPAATVRAGCVRAIAQLQINTAPVVTAVQSLKNDPDPRVRREVQQALSVLNGGQPLPLDASVRPVSGH